MNIEEIPNSVTSVIELRADLMKAIMAQTVRLGCLQTCASLPHGFAELLGKATVRGSFHIESVKQTAMTNVRPNFLKTLKVQEGIIGVEGVEPTLVLFLRQGNHAVQAIKFVKLPDQGWSQLGGMTFTKQGIQISIGARGTIDERKVLAHNASLVSAMLQMLSENLNSSH